MDVNNIIVNTINSLSQPHIENSIKEGEINLEHKNSSQPIHTLSKESVEGAIIVLNDAAKKVDSRVSFNYNEKTRRIIMRVQDPVTNEVVKQIPSKDMVKILENINDMVGLFIDEQR